MRELRAGDRVIAREGAKSPSGYNLSGVVAIVRSTDSTYFASEGYDTTIYLDERTDKGFFNAKSADLTRIPKHRAEGEAN